VKPHSIDLRPVLEVEERVEQLRERRRELEAERGRLHGGLAEVGTRQETLDARLREFGRRRVDWGDLGRARAISPEWGFDRGNAVDRHYIDAFIEANAADIRGRVLEVCDDGYTQRFGGTRVAHRDILDVDPANPNATIVADLCALDPIPSGDYDCVILTQVLQLIFDLRAALGECFRILRPGGVLLVTLPCASKVCGEYGFDSDFWRFTPASARRLFGEVFGPDSLTLQAYGNVLVTAAYLHGLALDEVRHDELEALDPNMPLLVSLRAQKKSPEMA